MPQESEVEISISEVCAIETQNLQVEAIKHVIKSQNQRVFGSRQKSQKIAKQLTAGDIRCKFLDFRPFLCLGLVYNVQFDLFNFG
jgi:hypothetical protein